MQWCLLFCCREIFLYLLRGLHRSFVLDGKTFVSELFRYPKHWSFGTGQHFSYFCDSICMRPIFTQVSLVSWPGSSYLTFGGNYWQLITNMQNIGIYFWTRNHLMTSITDSKYWVIYTHLFPKLSPSLMYGTIASSEKRRTLSEVGTMIYCIPDPHNPGPGLYRSMSQFTTSAVQLSISELSHWLYIVSAYLVSVWILHVSFSCAELQEFLFLYEEKSSTRTGNGVDPGWLAARHSTTFRRIRPFNSSRCLLSRACWTVLENYTR